MYEVLFSLQTMGVLGNQILIWGHSWGLIQDINTRKRIKFGDKRLLLRSQMLIVNKIL